jgi:signal transduction histidine kinase
VAGRTRFLAPDLDLRLVPGVMVGRPTPERVAALAAATGEALANVVRHAGATTATVTFAVTAAGTRVEIRDDGRGFDPATVDLGRGLDHGVVGRMRACNGTARLQSRPGAGTVVVLEAPATPSLQAVAA